MLAVMFLSGFWALRGVRSFGTDGVGLSSAVGPKDTPTNSELVGAPVTEVQGMAIAQLLLAFLALTNYHVQIITRISSGYPVWYWWVASQIVRSAQTKRGHGKAWSDIVIRYMIVYAIVQGGLYASFMPPA
jgi:phosphatidylinositol glycan class V